MKHTLLTAILVFAFVAPGFAKNGILMGKVTGAKGQVVNVSVIIIAGNGITAVASLKDGGLYYSDMIPEGQYDVSFVIDGISYKTNVTFTGNDGSNSTKPIFYNFVLRGGKLSLAMSDEDPFATSVLNAVKDEPALYDFGGGRNISLVLPSEEASTVKYNTRRRLFYIRQAFERRTPYNHSETLSVIQGVKNRVPISYGFRGSRRHPIALDNILPAPVKLKYAPLHILKNEPLLEGLEMKK